MRMIILVRKPWVGRETSMESISGQEGILSQQSGLMKKLSEHISEIKKRMTQIEISTTLIGKSALGRN